MKVVYDTVTDSISCPDLCSDLSAALMRNDPVRTVANVNDIMAFVKAADQAS